MDLSIILPTLNEASNISVLLPGLPEILAPLKIQYEVLIVDGGSSDGTVNIASQFGPWVKVLIQKEQGYAEALKTGFAAAGGDYMITLDSDLSHDSNLIPTLWEKRLKKDILIGSRYIPGGSAKMPVWRWALSRLLNKFVSVILELPFSDLSSGYRLYKSSVIRSIPLESSDFDILEEILIRAYAGGYSIEEVPIHYTPRQKGKSKAQLFRFMVSFIKTLPKMWSLRNSTAP